MRLSSFRFSCGIPLANSLQLFLWSNLSISFCLEHQSYSKTCVDHGAS